MPQHDRDRDWLLSLIAAVLFVALFAILFVAIVPWLLHGMGPIDWLFISIVCVFAAATVMALVVSGAAAKGDALLHQPRYDARAPLNELGNEASALRFEFPPRDAS